jgi:hypothetical protein
LTDQPLSLRALNRATLARQLLLRREKLQPVPALERLAGLQAQMPRPPFIGLWSRLEGFRREDLVGAIERREAIRGTMMRGTIHLMARKDFVAWRPVIQPVLTRGMESVLGDFAKTLDVEALHRAARGLFEQRPRTFADLREHLHGLFPTLNQRAMGHIVKMQLPVVQTPASAAPWAYPAAADFTLAESWLGEPLSANARPHAMALRYFAAFGPASVKDLQIWSGLKGARAVVDDLRPKLRAFCDDQGRELFDLPRAPRPAEDEQAPVRFLPEFDNLLLAHADRRRSVAEKHRHHLFTKNLLVPATFLVDGFVAGVWRVERAKNEARLVLAPFDRLDRRVRLALHEEGEQLLRFIEPDATRYVI